MAANTNLDLLELDPNTLKADFKNWLRDNKQFKDYNFDGSNMNLLLDLFSYNTYKNAFFTNMALSESFLDSAQIRSSILSHAKHLNYLPNSARSASARVRINFEATGDTAPYVIQKGSPLTAIIKNDSYTFTIPETITVASANTTYEFETDIYEGIYLKDTYTFEPSDITQRFPITNKNVDINSLTVTVFEDGNTVGDLYVYSQSLLDVTDISKVFFLQPSIDGSYEIIFGDNNLGRRPKIGSTIVLEYRISSGIEGNGGKIFSLDFDPTENDELTTSAEVTTLAVSRNGAPEETNESIAFLAPRYFQTQERATNPEDYSTILRKQFSEINDIYSYGGEELTPPEPGKVFVSIDLTDINGIPESKRTEYQRFLDPRRGFGTRIFFIEPEYSYVQVKSNVRYNKNTTTLSSESLKTIIRSEIIAFRDEFLDKFDAILRHSKLETAIDSADPSIVSSFSEFNLYKKLQVNTFGVPQDYDIYFGVAAISPTVQVPRTHALDYVHPCYSNEFFYRGLLCRIEDDGTGKMTLVQRSGSKDNFIQNIGTIDYSTSTIALRNFRVDGYSGQNLKLFISPIDKDFKAYRNNILTIESNEIFINTESLSL